MALGDTILDSGPRYTETVAGRFPVEPFNTFSNLAFLAIVVYWAKKVFTNVHKHRFLAFAIPVLFIGFIGGTMFHATRSSNLWLFLDWMPIMILGLSASIYYYRKQGLPLWGVPLLIAFPFVVMYLVFAVFEIRGGPSIGYSMIAVLILGPIARYLYKTKWKNVHLILYALGSFALALTFRTVDKYALLPMGTHFLWHLFGALATQFMFMYIYNDHAPKKHPSKKR